MERGEMGQGRERDGEDGWEGKGRRNRSGGTGNVRGKGKDGWEGKGREGEGRERRGRG